MNTYKIKDSLFVKGNKVISYETHVATINGKQLIELGKYSRTTTKHIQLVARLMGLQVVTSKKSMRDNFYKFDMGCVNLRNPDPFISPETSRIVFSMMGEGKSYAIIIAYLEGKTNKKDWDLLYKPKGYKRLVGGVKLLDTLKVFAD